MSLSQPIHRVGRPHQCLYAPVKNNLAWGERLSYNMSHRNSLVEAEQDPKKANPFEYGKMGYEHLKKIAINSGFEIVR